MKKLFLTVLLLLLVQAVSAQTQWGVKGGLNLANITNDDDGRFKPSVHFGVFAEFKRPGIISFQPELLYSRQGSFSKLDGVKGWMRLNYINLPILLKINAISNFSIDVGPQLGFMLNSKLKAKADGVTITMKMKDVYQGDINKFDVSVAMGLSYKLSSRFDIYGRYNLGLTQIPDDEDEKAKNSVIQLGLGYRF